jgi:hypothetical protein
MGAHFLSGQLFQARLLLSCFVLNVEGPASAAKKLSAFFVSASLIVERALNRRNTGEAEMRTALIVAITLTFTIGG